MKHEGAIKGHEGAVDETQGGYEGGHEGAVDETQREAMKGGHEGAVDETQRGL